MSIMLDTIPSPLPHFAIPFLFLHYSGFNFGWLFTPRSSDTMWSFGVLEFWCELSFFDERYLLGQDPGSQLVPMYPLRRSWALDMKDFHLLTRALSGFQCIAADGHDAQKQTVLAAKIKSTWCCFFFDPLLFFLFSSTEWTVYYILPNFT